jgi:benzoyl-CoA reductase/2-hydroxyglutaryl-CoA dehydratase subunit BcrC/BadD/HgdB
MIEKAGLQVLVDMTPATEIERNRVPIKYEDYWECSSESLLCLSFMKFAKHFKQVCQEWKVDGAIMNYPIGCREFCIEPVISREIITKELGIPVLLLECDQNDTRNYSAEAMRSRVEAFAEMLIAAKAAEKK